MYYIEAPEESYIGDGPNLFLAGGITGCEDWQKRAAKILGCKNMRKDLYAQYYHGMLQGAIFNPRRTNFDIKDSTAAQAQIKWEHERLWRADIVSMWFCKDQIQPICLFELGSLLARHKLYMNKWYLNKTLGPWSDNPLMPQIRISSPRPPQIIIGCHKKYPRIVDVLEQVKNVDPTLPVYTDFTVFINKVYTTVKDWRKQEW